MNMITLLEKLIAIERAIGVEDQIMLRRRLLDAQDYVLEMQKELAENRRKEPMHSSPEFLASSEFAA